MFDWLKRLVSPAPTIDDRLEAIDNDLCHVYCSLCYPDRTPRGYTHFCGTLDLYAGDSTPCDETCIHLMCVVCLGLLDRHMMEMHP